MNLKFVLLLLVGLLPSGLIAAYSEDSNEIFVETDAVEYKTGEELILTGFVPEKKMPIISISIYDPENQILTANTVEIQEDDSFLRSFSLDSPFYDKPGLYTVKLQYGKLKTETFFEISGSAPPEQSILEIEPVVPEVVVLVTDKSTYYDDDFVIISGIVSAIEEPSVLIGIYDPFDVPAGFYFGEIDSNLEFSVSFLVKSGVNFKTEGTYSIVAFYGESENTVTFDFATTSEAEEPRDESVEQPISEPDKNKEPKATNPPQIEQPKQKPKPIEDKPKSTTPIQENNQPKPTPKVKEEPKEPRKNLSVEDVELGILLNQIQLNCDKGDYLYSISYYDGMGPAMIRLCKYQESISHFDEALIDKPDNVEILTNKGVALAKLGFYSEALSYFDTALDLQSNFAPALNNKANVLSTTGNFEEAMNLYGLALSIDPKQKVSGYNFEKTKLQLEKYNLQNDIQKDSTPKPIPPPPEPPTRDVLESSQGQTSSDFIDQLTSVFSSIGTIVSKVFSNS